jgi:hypothetical protein
MRIATVLGFDAGLPDQPGARRLGDVGRSSRTRQVVDGLEWSHRLHPARTAGDALAIDAQRRGDLGRIAPVGQVQNDRRALDMMRRARAGERSQRGARFFGQGQRQCGGFARHPVSSAIEPSAQGLPHRPWSGQQGWKYGSLAISCSASVSARRSNTRCHSPVWRCHNRSKQSRLT